MAKDLLLYIFPFFHDFQKVMSDTLFSTRDGLFIYGWFKGNTQGLQLGFVSNYVTKTYDIGHVVTKKSTFM